MIKQTFNANTTGRDFVVGDLHGKFSLFMSALENIGFDPNLDRMFSVGDLVDRGDNSFDCLCLLDRDWFFPVKANHEQMMEDFLSDGPTGMWWYRNGGQWWSQLDICQRDDAAFMLSKIQKLPHLITVNMTDGRKFHVIHAELAGRPNEVITDDDLADDVKFAAIASRVANDGDSIIWGRTLFGDLYATETTAHGRGLHKAYLKKNQFLDFFNPKLSHIFSGHTPMVKPTTIGGQTNLDTLAFGVGRYSWAALTITEPLTGKFWKTNGAGTEEVTPVIL